MTSLYVVRNTFRAHGILHEVGTVIDDPSSIWLFRSRLGVRDIIELTEGGKDNSMWYDYLSTRVRGPIDDRICSICGKTSVEDPIVVTPQQDMKPEPKAVETPVKAINKTVAKVAPKAVTKAVVK